ncbi:MAG: hypothetical protein IKD58_12250, partial [Loktanella sp.]|nr:hypothetical protein [Loktanella sp.]
IEGFSNLLFIHMFIETHPDQPMILSTGPAMCKRSQGLILAGPARVASFKNWCVVSRVCANKELRLCHTRSHQRSCVTPAMVRAML